MSAKYLKWAFCNPFLRTMVMAIVLFTTPTAPAQVEGTGAVGGEAAAEGEFDLKAATTWDLDYAREEAFDLEMYMIQESQLQVGGEAVGVGVAAIHEAARAKSSILLGGAVEEIAPVVPEQYVVKKGDTLYYLSSYFFGNPDLWPSIWALNPQITNPNWIYPGQRLLLMPPAAAVDQPQLPQLVAPTTIWKEGTEYVRSLGFVDKDIEEETGKIIGSFAETMYLDPLDRVYIKYKKGKAPYPGSVAVVYESVGTVHDNEKRKIKYGKLVRILGNVRIESVDEKHEIAVGVINECVRPVERGDLVGPLKWKFKIVAPVKARFGARGKIIAALEDVTSLGQADIAFINLGKEDGVMEGNMVTILRKRDHYKEVLDKRDASPHFPWERIGEAIVIEVLRKTSTIFITHSSWSVRAGDRVELWGVGE